MSVTIVVKQNLSLGCPGDLGRSFDFKAGQVVYIGFIPTKNGDGSEPEKLSFWTGADIDFGLIFDTRDVAKVRITEEDPRLDYVRRMWHGPMTVIPNRGKPT